MTSDYHRTALLQLQVEVPERDFPELGSADYKYRWKWRRKERQ